MIRAVSRRWILVIAVAAVAGCGSEPRLSAGTARGMHDDVAAARTAARNGDPDAAVKALETLERRIGRAEDRGELSAEAADALQVGAARARRRAGRQIAEPQPTATATATATATPALTPTATATPEVTPEPKGKAKPGRGPKPEKGKKH
jgi:hypothetical protein